MRDSIYFLKLEKKENKSFNKKQKNKVMNKLKNIISIVGIIVKYGAVITAVIKGIQVVSEELEKIDFSENKEVLKVSKDSKNLKNE